MAEETLSARLRRVIGQPVRLDTAEGEVVGTVVSCTHSSVWVVAGDVDTLVPLKLVLGFT